MPVHGRFRDITAFEVELVEEPGSRGEAPCWCAPTLTIRDAGGSTRQEKLVEW
jgi:hypothetical protein